MGITKEIFSINVPLRDCLTILAILFAPLVALWIQGKLDERKEDKKRRLWIFKTLMATRASVLSLDHIQALNMIDIEFYNNRKYKEIKKSWREYLHARTKSPAKNESENTQFNKDCQDTLTSLLVKMGEALGYEFEEVDIKQSIYKPQGHVTEEQYH